MARIAPSPVDSLTPRERDVARLMGRGLTNPQIAEELGIGFGTAKTHVSQVIAKLGARSREEAARRWRSEQRWHRRLHRSIAGGLAFAGWKGVAVAGVAVAAVAVAVPVALVMVTAGGDEDAPKSVAAGFADHWERLPDPPIPPRVNVVAVWTGEEALFVGGDTFLCPPWADCLAPMIDLPFQDGAAYNPETNAWRRIADAPSGFAWASTGVLDGDVYFVVPRHRTVSHAFLRYDPAADSWEELALPPVESGYHHLVATDDAIVAYATTHEGWAVADYVFDPETGQWSELPVDPLAPSFDRSMAWHDGRLYLFAQPLVDRPGSAQPSLVRAARFDFGTGEWEVLPDSEILSSGPWYAEDGRIVNPALGGADGGEINNWGRAYPRGGIFDTNARAWLPLPAVPASDYWTGVLGRDGAAFFGTTGYFLDLETNRWVELPALDDPDRVGRRNILAAGTDVIAFGGERWAGGVSSPQSPGEVLDDNWIWRSGR